MKKSRRIRLMTLEIWGKMLKTVSRISLIWTEDLINLNILMILKALKIVMVDEKLAPKSKKVKTIPISEEMTMNMSKMFHEYMKYIFPRPMSFKIISMLNTNAKT